MLYEELNKRKKELGLTTEQLSQLSGVPTGTINKILSGETRSPRYDTIRALEAVLFAEEYARCGTAERRISRRGRMNIRWRITESCRKM